jgi:hypothetical protein
VKQHAAEFTLGLRVVRRSLGAFYLYFFQSDFLCQTTSFPSPVAPPFHRRGSSGHCRGLIAWLHNCRRLCARFERLAFIHEVFMKIACCIICWRQLQPSLCQRFLFKLAVPFYLRAPVMHASSFPSVRT